MDTFPVDFFDAHMAACRKIAWPALVKHHYSKCKPEDFQSNEYLEIGVRWQAERDFEVLTVVSTALIALTEHTIDSGVKLAVEYLTDGAPDWDFWLEEGLRLHEEVTKSINRGKRTGMLRKELRGLPDRYEIFFKRQHGPGTVGFVVGLGGVSPLRVKHFKQSFARSRRWEPKVIEGGKVTPG